MGLPRMSVVTPEPDVPASIAGENGWSWKLCEAGETRSGFTSSWLFVPLRESQLLSGALSQRLCEAVNTGRPQIKLNPNEAPPLLIAELFFNVIVIPGYAKSPKPIPPFPYTSEL